MDIRRTVLWMIFSFSLLLLWNNWQIHNGKPSLFGGPTPAASTTDPQAGANNATPSVPSAPATAATAPSAVPGAATPAAARSEEVVITTDVLRLTFDTMGAQLVRAELLKYPATGQPDKPTVLLDRSAGLNYVVQSGVVGAPNGQSFPTHQTPFRLVTSERQLTGDNLVVSFEGESGGVKVTKSFTLHKGRYDIDVRHDLANVGSAPVTPALYLQLERDGNDPADTSSFYHTFTGFAVYSEQDKFQKSTFSDIEKKKANYIKQADNGWIAVVQHYFATAWVPPQGKPRTNELLEVQKNLYAARSIEAVGEIAPGAASRVDSHLWVGPQDQKAMAALAPGLELVVDYGWLTIIAKPLFTLMTWLHSLLGNWGWTIVALTVLIKAIFYPLAAASYRSMARMKQVAPRLQALKEKYGDDKQKLNMPLVFGGMMFFFPAGLVLYWCVNNTLSIAQQWSITRAMQRKTEALANR